MTDAAVADRGRAEPPARAGARGPMAFVRRHPTVALGLALIARDGVVSALAP